MQIVVASMFARHDHTSTQASNFLRRNRTKNWRNPLLVRVFITLEPDANCGVDLTQRWNQHFN